MRTPTCVPVWCLAALIVLGFASAVAGQPAPPPEEPKIWTVAASGGLAVTSGNTDTSTLNAGYDFTYDPQTKNIVKSDALYLRGETDDEITSDRLGVNIRDQYKLTTRAFVFGQNQYLRDRFKDIDYLIAPTGGLGYKLFDTPETKMEVDAGVGVVWEKNTGEDVDTSGAITASEKLAQKLTANTTLTQSVAALWKTQDFDDALYTFGIGVAAGMSTHTQLKIEVLDTYKNKPPSASVKKNDVATIIAVVYKM